RRVARPLGVGEPARGGADGAAKSRRPAGRADGRRLGFRRPGAALGPALAPGRWRLDRVLAPDSAPDLLRPLLVADALASPGGGGAPRRAARGRGAAGLSRRSPAAPGPAGGGGGELPAARRVDAGGVRLAVPHRRAVVPALLGAGAPRGGVPTSAERAHRPARRPAQQGGGGGDGGPAPLGAEARAGRAVEGPPRAVAMDDRRRRADAG